MDQTLKLKIMNYERQIFEHYLKERQRFLKKLEKIETNKLTQDQLLVFINDIKNVIDPVKESINSMKHFNKLNFNDTYSIDINNFLLFYLIFGKTFFRGIGSSSEEEGSDKESSDNSELSSE